MESDQKAFYSRSVAPEGQIFTFLFPKDMVLPERFYDITCREFVAAIEFADKVLQLQTSVSLEEHEQKQLASIRAQHQKDLETLQREQTTLRQDIERQHQYELRNAENQRKTLAKQIADLEIHLQQASASADIIRSRFQEEAERRIAQKDADLQHVIGHLRQELDRERAERKEQEAKYAALQSVRTNSSRKGREGEKQFETLSAEIMGWTLTYSGKTGHAADYVSHLHGLQVRFEVKQYNYTVATKEMEKFRRDLQEHPETDVGIFVSMETTLTGMQEIQVEYTPTHQAILWIPQFLQNDVERIFQWIDRTILLVKPYRKFIHEKSKDQDFAHMKEKVERAILGCQGCVTRMTENVKHLETDRRALQDRLDTMMKNQGVFLAALHYEIELILSLLTGQEHIRETEGTESKITKGKRKSTKKSTTASASQAASQ